MRDLVDLAVMLQQMTGSPSEANDLDGEHRRAPLRLTW
jgi:hypothetical protein